MTHKFLVLLLISLISMGAYTQDNSGIEQQPGNQNAVNPNGMMVNHDRVGGFVPGEPVEITVMVNFANPSELTAIGLQESIPEGWTFHSMGDLQQGINPNITPQPGAAEQLEFAWIVTPDEWPTQFSYYVTPGEGGGSAQIRGIGEYRTTGGTLNSEEDIVHLEGADTQPPVLTLRGSDPMVITEGDPWNDPGARANDNADGDLSDSVRVSGNVNPSAPGTYTLTYTVSDRSGNQATPVTREVIVEPRSDDPASGGGANVGSGGTAGGAGAIGSGGSRTNSGRRGYGFYAGTPDQESAGNAEEVAQKRADLAVQGAEDENQAEARRLGAQAQAAQNQPAAAATSNASSGGTGEENGVHAPGAPDQEDGKSRPILEMQRRLAQSGGRGTDKQADEADEADETAGATTETSSVDEDSMKPPLSRTQDAATSGTEEAKDPYGDSDAYTTDMYADAQEDGAMAAQANGGTGGGDGDGDAATTEPGFFANVAAVFTGMGPMDYVRLGIMLVVLAFILVGAAIAWRVAYSPRPQRKSSNSKHVHESS
ncbi:MAG: DUF5011 domain-containing protein [Candidatus Hydrogenedentota bacterium]